MKTTEAYTIITGASMGLGKELAIENARRGKNLVLVALPESGLEELCEKLRQRFGTNVIAYECDLIDEASLENMVNWVTANFSVNQLINNAGIGGTARFDESSTAYLDRIIHLNIRATTMLTRLLLPELKRQQNALIINVASLAAFGALPFKTIYPASKAFIYSFSRGLNRELKGTGVRVAVVAPGPFISNPEVASRIMKQGILARLGVMTAGDITRRTIDGVEKGRKVIVPGFWNKLNRMLLQWVPEEFRLSFMFRIYKRELP